MCDDCAKCLQALQFDDSARTFIDDCSMVIKSSQV